MTDAEHSVGTVPRVTFSVRTDPTPRTPGGYLLFQPGLGGFEAIALTFFEAKAASGRTKKTLRVYWY
jgi:hypothetical protein